MADIVLEHFDELLQQITAFEKMYEQARVVDPVNKKVLYSAGQSDEASVGDGHPCYGIWDKGSICRNCISMRAYNENETFIKIETAPDKIVMVTAIPVMVGESVFVVELLKNVTRSMISDDINMTEGTEIRKLLDQANAAAVTDDLTKIYNKRYILEKLPAEIALARLRKQPLSIIMADIDHFKKINDTYGHLAGDRVLRKFAEILKQSIRHENDWTARFGGEEFIICLADTDDDAARTVAESIRKSVEECPIDNNGEIIRLTSSFGLCTVQSDEMIDYESVIRCADGKLYEAKRSGRNKVC